MNGIQVFKAQCALNEVQLISSVGRFILTSYISHLQYSH